MDKNSFRFFKKIFVFCLSLFFILNVFSTSNAANEDSNIDLIIEYVDFPKTMVEDEKVTIIVRIKNIGEEELSSDKELKLGLYIDYNNQPVSVNSTYSSLSTEETCYINLSWIATLDDNQQHILSVRINYDNEISEENYNNNVWDLTVFFKEKDTQLEISDVNIDTKAQINQSSDITVSVKNNGAGTSEEIKLILSDDDDKELFNTSKNDGLKRNEVFDFLLKWTPKKIGSQTLIISLFFEGEIIDTDSKTVLVNVSNLEWWNSSWHYRYFIPVEGEGNVSKNFNFTNILNQLGVFSEFFESNKIVIIEYSTSGEIIGRVQNFSFNESSDFNPIRNAKGTLIWSSIGSNSEKYYCIYFDILDNPGFRTVYDENEDIVESGDIKIISKGFSEGWWGEINLPKKDSYIITGEIINVSVETAASVVNVEAFIFKKTNQSNNYTITLNDVNEGLIWNYTGLSIDTKGNWVISINCSDAGSYYYNIERDFYVGRPDIKNLKLTYLTNYSSFTDKIYKYEMVNFTASLTSSYANVENVDYHMIISYLKTNEIVYEKTGIIPIIFKNKKTYINFSLSFKKIGNYRFNLSVDTNNIINESKEKNNKLQKIFEVYGWPDLRIDDVFLPNNTIYEKTRVRIDVIVTNNGEGSADNYDLALYAEPARSNIMTYSNMIFSKNITIAKNETKKFDLYWDNADDGVWLIGVSALVDFGKKDLNINDNKKVADGELKIRGYEKNKPIISYYEIQPEIKQQGEMISIFAKIIDDSGLSLVSINITDPDGDSYYSKMIRTNNDIFRYDFENTYLAGIYHFKIDAFDVSYYENNNSTKGIFIIDEDSKKPIIYFFKVDPDVQLTLENVSFNCIAEDNIDIDSAVLEITFPDGDIYEYEMSYEKDKYVYKNIYNITGRYRADVIIKDKAGNKISATKYFWITKKLNDKDNDGIPDKWEEKNGLNSSKKSDANKDYDNDGFTNLEEYKHGTNPQKDIFMENTVIRIKENMWYLLISMVLFILITIISIFVIRRKKT